MGFRLTPVSPEDPQANGFVENFVKSICKLVHTAAAEHKDPKRELHNFLLQYRATPHSTTERSPAELLFGRKIKTKLPQLKKNKKDSPEIAAVRKTHDEKKRKQKQYFDIKHKARPKNIKQGDKVLLKQKKSTVQPPFNPNPFTVTKVKGNQLTLSDGHRTRVRDKNYVKPVRERKPMFQLAGTVPHVNEESDADIEIAVKTHATLEDENIDGVDDPSATQEIDGVDDQLPTQEIPRVQEPTPCEVQPEDADQLAARMRLLIEAADAREAESGKNKKLETSPPVTRSRGVRLSWNPNMNSSLPLVDSEEEE